MKTFAYFLLSGLAVAQGSTSADCPKLPGGVVMGVPVPMVKEHIPTGCADLEILVARGTSEPDYKEGNGKFGVIIGDPLIGNLTKTLTGARGYPVQYPASNQTGGIVQGGLDVADRLKKMSTECPKMKFVLVGYSQGAAVMHAATNKRIPEELYSKIIALVMYGDPVFKMSAIPAFPAALQSKLLENCAVGDSVSLHKLVVCD
ncbi:alpha/beta-hydrolase [Microthyrium microscopicum]|uniref:Alpha/beta-hydrolase n=1 Tax=Microthyrium microscopicum TaxID=703497 RepID=A0A6A6UDS7_9PEZI|nr:alpha/beta-hydrolase [Microthyrium microscopicum]